MGTQTTSSFRTSDNNKKALADLWGSTSAGAEHAVDAYVNLRKRVLQNMRGYFTKQELTGLVDNQNGTIFSPDLFCNAETWLYGVEDGIKYDGLDNRWGFDSVKLLQKLEELDDTQAYFMREEIDRFWQSQSSEKIETMSLEEFINQYT